MATKVEKDREKILQVEVKRRRVKAGGGYEPFWKLKDLDVALVDEDTEFRCKDCGGALKVFKSHKGGVAVAHAEHKDKAIRNTARPVSTSERPRTAASRARLRTRSSSLAAWRSLGFSDDAQRSPSGAKAPSHLSH